ncbi:hypothetical protein BDW67DRAFT_108041 [Aspergillus spinulosporus]
MSMLTEYYTLTSASGKSQTRIIGIESYSIGHLPTPTHRSSGLRPDPLVDLQLQAKELLVSSVGATISKSVSATVHLEGRDVHQCLPLPISHQYFIWPCALITKLSETAGFPNATLVSVLLRVLLDQSKIERGKHESRARGTTGQLKPADMVSCSNTALFCFLLP